MEIIMGRLAYSEVLLAIFIPVAIISFLTPISRYRRYKPLLFSIGVVAPIYILWDELAVIYDTWSFDKYHVIGLYFFYLPLEEVAFFLVVPFSTLLIFEVLRAKIKGDFPKRIVTFVGLILSAFFIIFGLLYISKSYTSVASFFAAFSIITALILDRDLMVRKSLWLYIAISYIPFIFFDHIMVSLPIFTYGKGSIIGIRIWGIPFEEFMYVFSLLLLYTVFYDFSRNRLGLGGESLT